MQMHTIRMHVELMPDRVPIKLDIKNAFNAFKRVKGHRVMSREFPDTARALHNFYSSHADSLFRDTYGKVLRIILQTGASQGDVFGGCCLQQHTQRR